MPKLHQDEPYYDFIEVQEEVEAKCGRDTRNWAGTNFSDDKPYQDFWHKVLDYLGDFNKGAIFFIDFEAMGKYYTNEENSPWVQEICNEFIKVLGEPMVDRFGDRGYRMKADW